MAGNPTLSKEVVAALLDKLGEDDAFRALFASDPAAALEQVGAAKADAAGCARCLKVTRLADKKTIRDSRTALTGQLTAAMDLRVIHLDAR